MEKGRSRSRSLLWWRNRRHGLPCHRRKELLPVFACRLDSVAVPSSDDFLKHTAKHNFTGDDCAFPTLHLNLNHSELHQAVPVYLIYLQELRNAISAPPNILERHCWSRMAIRFLCLYHLGCALVCIHRDVCALRLFHLCFSVWFFLSSSRIPMEREKLCLSFASGAGGAGSTSHTVFLAGSMYPYPLFVFCRHGRVDSEEREGVQNRNCRVDTSSPLPIPCRPLPMMPRSALHA